MSRLLSPRTQQPHSENINKHTYVHQRSGSCGSGWRSALTAPPSGGKRNTPHEIRSQVRSPTNCCVAGVPVRSSVFCFSFRRRQILDFSFGYNVFIFIYILDAPYSVPWQSLLAPPSFFLKDAGVIFFIFKHKTNATLSLMSLL